MEEVEHAAQRADDVEKGFVLNGGALYGDNIPRLVKFGAQEEVGEVPGRDRVWWLLQANWRVAVDGKLQLICQL